MLTSAAWADPHQLHPWFRMPSQKRKDLSDEDEDGPRAAYHEPRHSLSPLPRSPKRRRCDVLEAGMSQLTLEGLSYAVPPAHDPSVGDTMRTGISPSPSSSYVAPTIQIPNPSTFASTSSQPCADGPPSPYVTHIPRKPTIPVVLPGSVEEPASPEATATGEPDVVDVSMKGSSWYEIEKDRIVITDLEDSDVEDEETTPSRILPVESRADLASFKISSALLDRLPKPHILGPIGPEPSPTNALVLYRPLVVPDEAEARRREADKEKEKRTEALAAVVDEPQPMGEEVPMEEDTRPCTPMVESVEPLDEPMDIEML
ncbi:hypothetical protein LXA43DRAFT_987709 [Ganoderma leucocontextum]|nr:hypothetical protein LXA43DRAFT_987709 [Ganoderma leucocontextum]